MSDYDWYPSFLLFGPTGSGKTKFASYLQRYQMPCTKLVDKTDAETGRVFEQRSEPILNEQGKQTYRDMRIEIADIGHGLYSWEPKPHADMIWNITSFEDLVKYLATIEERNSDVVLIDDLSLLNYKLTMESAQIRQGRDKDTQTDIKNLVESGKYGALQFIPPQIKDRGIASEKLRIMLYNVIDLHKILIITCGEKLEAEKIRTGNLGSEPIFTGKTYREPNLPGNMPNELPYFVSEVFYMYRVAGAESLVYKLRFLPDGGMVSCPKDRSNRLKQFSKVGKITCDAEGKYFDKIMDVLPWPEGQKPIRK